MCTCGPIGFQDTAGGSGARSLVGGASGSSSGATATTSSSSSHTGGGHRKVKSENVSPAGSLLEGEESSPPAPSSLLPPHGATTLIDQSPSDGDLPGMRNASASPYLPPHCATASKTSPKLKNPSESVRAGGQVSPPTTASGGEGALAAVLSQPDVHAMVMDKKVRLN